MHLSFTKNQSSNAQTMKKNVLIKLPVLLQSDYNQFVISLNLKKEIFWAQKTKTKPSVSSYDYLFEREGDVW